MNSVDSKVLFPRNAALSLVLLASLATVACGGDDDTSAEASAGPTTISAAGTGGSGSGGEGGGTASSSSAGTGGGSSVPCLDASSHAEAFDLLADDLCVVARYTAPFVVGFDENYKEIAPTWGRHGGPLTLEQTGNAFTLTRWKVPTEAEGALTVDSTLGPVDTAIPPNLAPASLFLNAAAQDLPFGGFTAVGWAEYGSPKGELLLVGPTKIDARFGLTSLYAVAGLAGKDRHRVLTASASALGTVGSDIGVHASDLCNGAVCANGTAVVTKSGDASGPVVTDAVGNAFAVFPNIAKGTQSLVGYGAGSIAPGVKPTGGATLATLDGSGTSLAALAPTASAAGVVFFQPAVMFVPGDVVAQRFEALDAKTLTAKGATAKAIVPKKMGTDVRLMVDGNGRLWVGLRTSTAMAESTFFALARKN